ncbi:MAG: TonB-dependent receptor plug domain-containing protein [Reichenbachiella sp.]
MNRLVFCLLVNFVMFDTFCQAQDDASSDSTVTLDAVYVQSALFELPVAEFSGALTILRPAKIDRGEGLYVQPILNAIPGVYMHSGTLNTNRITIRGIGSRSPYATNKIKAYLDEIPLSTGEGETTIEDIDFSTLSSVEVYRGPSSTEFGAGLGGAIHLITDHSSNRNQVSTDMIFGSFGLKRYNLNAEIASTSNSLKLYYQKVLSDGYRENNAYDKQSISVIGNTQLGKKSRLSLYMNTTHLIAQIPSSIDSATYVTNPSAAAPTWLSAEGFENNKRLRVGLSLKTAINRSYESSLAIFFNGGDSREVTPIGRNGKISEMDFMNFGFRGKIRGSYLNERLQLVLGTELFFEDFDIKNFTNENSENGELLSDLSQTRNYGNVFLASVFNPNESWRIELGVNLNFSMFESNDELMTGGNDLSGNYSFDPILSPKVSVSRSISPNMRIYALAAHGFSLPSFEETLYPDGQINNAIMPESGMNYELGVKGHLISKKLYFELAGYSMRVKDLLVSRRDVDDNYIGINAGKTIHNGIEFMINHQIIQTTGVQISHQMTMTYMNFRFDEFIDDEMGDFSGNDLTGVPTHTIDYSWNVNSKVGLYTNLNWQNTGRMPMRDDNSIYSDAYHLVNCKVGYERSIRHFDLRIYAGVNNVLDEKYASMLLINAGSWGGAPRYYYPGLPTNYYTGLKLGYRF